MNGALQEEIKFGRWNDFEGFRKPLTLKKGKHERKFDEFTSAVPCFKT